MASKIALIFIIVIVALVNLTECSQKQLAFCLALAQSNLLLQTVSGFLIPY